MKDVSYEILDLFETYGSDPEGIRRALAAEKRPEYLYALSDIRQNLLEWYPFDGTEQVLEIGSGYGALTGLLAKRAAHVTVLDESDENLEVNRRRNGGCANISYGLEDPSRKFDLVVICGVKRGLRPRRPWNGAAPSWRRRARSFWPARTAWDCAIWRAAPMGRTRRISPAPRWPGRLRTVDLRKWSSTIQRRITDLRCRSIPTVTFRVRESWRTGRPTMNRVIAV